MATPNGPMTRGYVVQFMLDGRPTYGRIEGIRGFDAQAILTIRQSQTGRTYDRYQVACDPAPQDLYQEPREQIQADETEVVTVGYLVRSAAHLIMYNGTDAVYARAMIDLISACAPKMPSTDRDRLRTSIADQLGASLLDTPDTSTPPAEDDGRLPLPITAEGPEIVHFAEPEGVNPNDDTKGIIGYAVQWAMRQGFTWPAGVQQHAEAPPEAVIVDYPDERTTTITVRRPGKGNSRKFRVAFTEMVKR